MSFVLLLGFFDLRGCWSLRKGLRFPWISPGRSLVWKESDYSTQSLRLGEGKQDNKGVNIEDILVY
jgi:hypothetical protein